MFEKTKDRWHEKFAARLLDEAKHDFTSRKTQLSPRLLLGKGLAVLILATPFIVLAWAIALILLNKASLFSLVIGAILIAFAYILLPTRPRNTIKTYSAADLPNLFALLDQLADQMGTRPPSGVHLDHDMNAYMARFKPVLKQEEWVLGIGMSLWTTLSSGERVAVLAHELAHMINDDPQRLGVYHDANEVLLSWYDTFSADAGDNFHVTEFLQMFGAGFVKYLYLLLNTFSFSSSQLAEYRADAFAARAAGRSHVLALLQTTSISRLSSHAILELYPYAKDQNGRIFDHIARAIQTAPPDVVARIMQETKAEKRRVDASHPPTTMRMEFIQSLPEDTDARKIDAKTIDFEGIDAELAPHKHAIGKDLMQELNAAEFDR